MATSHRTPLPGQINLDDDDDTPSGQRGISTGPSFASSSSSPPTTHHQPRESAAFRLLHPSASTITTPSAARAGDSEPPATRLSSGRKSEANTVKKKAKKDKDSGAKEHRSSSSPRETEKTTPRDAQAGDAGLADERPSSNEEKRKKRSLKKKKTESAKKMESDLSIAAIEEETAAVPLPPSLSPRRDIDGTPGAGALEATDRANASKRRDEDGSSGTQGAPYRRQSMHTGGGTPHVRATSWRQRNRSAEALDEVLETPRRSGSAEVSQGDGAAGGSEDVLPPDGPTGSADADELTFVLPELARDGAEESGRMVRETWPADHVMLLYMLSRYAVCARSTQDQETWIRQIPLLVLMYEGIAAGILNFDYAPAALVIAQEGKPKRIWMNTTQDGKSAIDDLREANLINGLKLSTKDYHSVTAFQVSLRGLQLLGQVSKELKAKVDSFIFAPKPYRHELLKIRYIPIKDPPDTEQLSVDDPNAPAMPSWGFNSSDKQLPTSSSSSVANDSVAPKEESGFNEEGRFVLESIGYYRYSEVTETEDVSYVSSPFVPQCVRSPDAFQPLTSNAHRAAEAASGQSNIRDELSEAITLMNPVCLIGEWIPFGSNQIVALNERLGSMDRCQGGLFTSLIDDRPTDTQFEVPPGLTQVRILDYDPVRFINFEAEINFPEEDGIVQVENFGIHLSVDGTIFYGIKVDAILDKRADRVSVDLLSRLLVDIHQDSSEVMDDLLSSYQCSLLDMVFLGDVANRGKFNMIIADQIDPFMPGLEYMDRGDFENELKQVLGDIHCAYDIGEDSVMIVGRDGMLVAGSAGRRFEKVFVAYFSLLCREMFLRSFFTRIFVLEELLKRIRELIFRAKEDPNHITTIRAKLNQATSDLILFTDTLGYLLESLEFVKIPQKSATGASIEEEEIFSYLDLVKQHHDILLRARDLEKLVHGAKYEIVNLRQMAEVLNASQLEDIFKTVEGNTKLLADSSIVTKKSGLSLEIIQLMLAGSFAFTVLDRIPGGSLNIEAPQWVLDVFAEPIINVPFLFFVLNMVWMVIAIVILVVYKRRRHREVEIGRRTVRVKVSKPIDVVMFETFLATRSLQQQESVCEASIEIRRVMWNDFADTSPTYCSKAASALVKTEPLTVKQHIEEWWRRRKRSFTGLFRPSKARGAPVGGLAANSVAPSNGMATRSGEASSSPELEPPSADASVAVEVEYDSRHGFLHFVTFHFHRPKEAQPPSQGRLSAWWRRVSSPEREPSTRRPPAPASPTGKRSSTQTAKTLIMDQSTKKGLGVVSPESPEAAAMSAAEIELMTWFAWTLKHHKVIPNVDAFLA
ncbi:hypothetical protein P43SY_005674 [Pythium insidiosum]|uniref:Uncharacterized protein n=1 Tax=Pythium insidiosum TaxID=114742 RepID=A0AAD5LWH3_PYTIN|nr:hypothetical protein P43SY_005674 [Pythium insidiosum]